MHHPHRRLVLVTLFALATLGALVVARPPLSTSWSRGEDLALVTAWVVAIAASVWLFVVSAGCAVALGCSRPDVARRLAPALPAGIRRLVELALVGSCLALPVLPAGASTPLPGAGAAAVVVDQPVVRAPDAAPGAVASPPAPETAAVATRVVVRPGDNLWLIARIALTPTTGQPPSEAAVARYWHAVIVANRTTLRSGDPSLIFPGEIVALPSPTSVS